MRDNGKWCYVYSAPGCNGDYEVENHIPHFYNLNVKLPVIQKYYHKYDWYPQYKWIDYRGNTWQLGRKDESDYIIINAK